MAVTNKKNQVSEIIKCGQDPVYFFNKYVKIQHPVQGLISFDTYDFQDECVNMFIENRFSIILKSRQLGMSTLTAAYASWLALFQKDKNILIIATKLSVAQNFIKKVKTIIRNLPQWLVLPTIVTNNKQLIEFSHGSSVKAIPTSDDAGRSEALSLLIIDEAAFVKNFDDLWMGLYPTISTGGRVILLSTPNGVGGQYYKLYTDAEAGLNEFASIKIPWDAHPERDDEWFKKETSNLSTRQISQEFLCDFASSGETLMDKNDIRWLTANVRPPIERAGPGNNVWVWKYPLSEHKYIISADVARGDSKDYSAFHIIDVDSCECVVEYKGKIPPDRFGDLLSEYGLKYNKALVCPENNSYGYATILRLKEIQYPNLYYPKRKGAYVGGYVPVGNNEVAGFATTAKTRNIILTKLEEVVRNKQLYLYSSRLIEEIKTFTWKGNKAQAMRGYNDDLVMSIAIGVWLFDSSDRSRDLSIINKAMLESMSFKSNTYKGNKIVPNGDPSRKNKSISEGSTQWSDRVGVSKEFDWLFK